MQSLPSCSRWQTARSIFGHSERWTLPRRSFAQVAPQYSNPESPRDDQLYGLNASTRPSVPPPKPAAPFTPPKPTTEILVERMRHGDERLLSKPYVFPRKAEQVPLPRPRNAPPSDKLHDQVTSLLARRCKVWHKQKPLYSRLRAFGVPPTDIPVLLSAFARAAEDGNAIITHVYDESRELELWEDLSNTDQPDGIDRAITRVLFTWIHDEQATAHLPTSLSTTLEAMRNLFVAADISYPHEEFQLARSIHRKIIMHVGPTNSGKTHNALRALAAARSGVYAGPLRLLAHEIWERLNKGQIVPLGVDPDLDTEPDVDSAMDVGPAADGGAAVRKRGTSKYVRLCNMVTGEEQKTVDESAGLLSCTVEMVNTFKPCDVAVIDEIQLIGDQQRGGAWTKAVLGMPAKELHLCGEETAVPIIEQLVKDTGDELIVNRYQRLSPLRVADHSLQGDLTLIRKGDCIVTFSRSSIFDLKKRVEEATGLRCAVAYGALPPELRSEQAALFNDPTSGYDVLVGSDALGMGLNLKIRRMILSATRKWTGKAEESLSISQIKQIAGRAGRYGLHGDDEGGGVAMTLHEEDMPALRAALNAPLPQLRYARISDSPELIGRIAECLPPGSTSATALEVFDTVTVTRPPFKVVYNKDRIPIANLVDTRGGDLGLIERLHLANAPVNLRDLRVADGMANYVKAYRATLSVDIRKTLATSGLLNHLKYVLERKAKGGRFETGDALPPLESLHKLLSVYIWLSFRNPIAWPDMEEAQVIKLETEAAMTWCLESVAAEKGNMGTAGKRKYGGVSYYKKYWTDSVEAKVGIHHDGAAYSSQRRGANRA